ncbi:MAG: helix-turn-helix domain-containing protein [Myxococcales bacterium]|nr:helix-turn-helix domain-containing protein [Myxococcales bacterium]
MSSDEPLPIEAPAEVRGVGKVIVVGGGRGGVGKSLVAENLAIYLAQLGKSVALVDADPVGANLHAHFGLPAARVDAAYDDDPAAYAAALVETEVQGLRLLPGPHDSIELPALLRAGRKGRYLAALRNLPVDYLVLDAGPGAGPFPIEAMLSADLAISVTVPEPPAIEATYRFARAAFRKRLRRALLRDRFRLPVVDRAIAEIGMLPSPLALVRVLERMDKSIAELVWNEAARMRLYLVVNQTRVRTDVELGTWMSELAEEHYGISAVDLGHIEHDDTVWLAVRRHRPLLVDSPTSKAARNIERIARRVIALLATHAERGSVPRPLPAPPTLYATLGVGRASSDEEIRRAYKRKKEIYEGGGLAISSLFTAPELAKQQSRLDEAYDTLLDGIRRRAYDLSTFPETDAMPAAAHATPRASDAEQILLRSELAREIGPDTEFTGELLRKVRESQGVDLGEISARTKIAKAHLLAIEDERFVDLPAAVYVRGFVSELAKFLKLDAAQVQRTYLRRMGAPSVAPPSAPPDPKRRGV